MIIGENMSTWLEKKRLEAEKNFFNLLTYTIPKYLKQAEFPFLQKSVNKKYNPSFALKVKTDFARSLSRGAR